MGKTPEDGSIYYLVETDKLRFKRPCVYRVTLASLTRNGHLEV